MTSHGLPLDDPTPEQEAAWLKWQARFDAADPVAASLFDQLTVEGNQKFAALLVHWLARGAAYSVRADDWPPSRDDLRMILNVMLDFSVKYFAEHPEHVGNMVSAEFMRRIVGF